MPMMDDEIMVGTVENHRKAIDVYDDEESIGQPESNEPAPIMSHRLLPERRKNLADYYREEMKRLNVQSGVYLSFSKLSYTIRQKVGPVGQTRTVDTPLLKEVSGYVKPGMMLLLLGPPGAGKTTLLELLSGRKPSTKDSIIQGQIQVDGKDWTDDFNRISGYVTQEDIHFPTMTVRETFAFSSVLRNHALVMKEKKLERVGLVLDMLGLSHVADTIVGNELLRGVSGGEKKRVSIGVELVKGPSILFMDEPTTGLDAAAAIEVVQHLRHIADAGIPVICSLLQPSQDIFDLFDTILILNKRDMTYFGPIDEALGYFEHVAGYKCPESKNVAEFLLEIHSDKGDRYKMDKLGAAQVEELPAVYKESKQYQELGRKLWRGIKPSDPSTVTKLQSESPFATTIPFQAWQCTARAVKNMLRNPAALRMRAIRSIIMGFLLGSLFWQMGLDQHGASNRVSLLFFCITFTSMGSIAAIPQVCEERTIFYHQRASHFYRTISYFISAVLIDIPLSIAETFLFTIFVFWMSGMNAAGYGWHYAEYFGILFATNLLAKQFCRMCAAATPNIQMASRLAPAILCIWLVFAGFLIPRNSIPAAWIWMNVISPFRYTLESMAINELSSLDVFSCENSEFVPPVQYRSCFNNGTACPIDSGDAMLKQFGLYETYKWMNIDFAVLWGFYFIFCIGTYLALSYFNFNIPRQEVQTPAPKPQQREMKKLTVAENTRLIGGDDEYGSINDDEISENLPLVSHHEQQSGAYLSFHDLCYSVVSKPRLVQRCRGIKGEEKRLLNHVNGYAKPGLMVALMGASGAGKTTLLDVLAGRKTGGNIEGQILLNGRPKDKFSKRLIGYVEQMSVHMPTLTVREAIQFSARMRLPSEVSDAEKMRRVEEIIDKLGLRYVADSVIGEVATGGISPELRKKTSIAAEMVSSPAILFLDEPTSGLDSQAAEAVMDAARIVCDTGVPIICTIHQPSEDLFFLFDWVLLLKPGGFVIYFGPMGENGSQILDYFRQYGLECAPGKNPADFVLECSGAGIGGADDGNPEDERAKLKRQLESFNPSQAWLESSNAADVNRHLSEGIIDQSAFNPLTFTDEYATSMFAQLRLCVRRAFLNKFRQPQQIRAYIFMYIVMAMVIGTLYWQLDDSALGARNRVALIYFSTIFAALGAFAAVPGVVMARAVYYREKPSFLRPFPFFVAQSLSEVPFTVIGTSIYCAMIYFMVGLNLADYGARFVLFVFVYSFASVLSVAFAQMIAVLSPSQEAASATVGVLLSILSLFAGFIIPKDNIPIYWKWLHYLSIFKYPLEALSINEMLGKEFSCPNGIGAINVPTSPLGYTSIEYCPISSGTQFIAYQFNMYETWQYFWIDVGVMFLLYAGMLLITYIGLRFVNHSRR